MQISNRTIGYNTPIKNNNNVSFSGNIAEKIINIADFKNKTTSRGAIMLLYTGCILSRLACSRDKYELSETTLRDSFGWTALFFASIAAEKMLSFLTDKINKVKNDSESLFRAKTGTDAPKKLWDVLKAKSNFILKSASDIESIENEVIKKQLKKAKNISYFGSMLVAAALLGVGIPLINVLSTKSKIKKQQAQPSTQNNITMQSFLSNAALKGKVQ